VTTVAVGHRAAVGAERRAHATALAATSVIMMVLVVGAVARLMGAPADEGVLWFYKAVLAGSAVAVFAVLTACSCRRIAAAITVCACVGVSLLGSDAPTSAK
jgi:hypothetical protein